MRIPYGEADFYKLRTRGQVYVDRTDRLPVVEEGARLVGQISRRDVLWAIESMRERYLYPKQEHELDTTDDGPGGVNSAMAKARGL